MAIIPAPTSPPGKIIDEFYPVDVPPLLGTIGTNPFRAGKLLVKWFPATSAGEPVPTPVPIGLPSSGQVFPYGYQFSDAEGTPSPEPPPAPPAGDALWDDVLLRMDFESGAVDQSPRVHTLTPIGTPALAATYAKYGEQGLTTSSGGYSYSVLFADQFGANDFCIEGWFANTEAQPNGAKLFDDGDGAIYVDLLDNLGLGTYVRATAWAAGWSNLVNINSTQIDSEFYVSDTVMHHVAFNRNGDRFNLFIDGVLRGTADAPIPDMELMYSATRSIGCTPGGSNFLQGGMDDVRITIGHSRYGNDDFTPPTAALPTNAL